MHALAIALLLNATSAATPPVDSDRPLGVFGQVRIGAAKEYSQRGEPSGLLTVVDAGLLVEPVSTRRFQLDLFVGPQATFNGLEFSRAGAMGGIEAGLRFGSLRLFIRDEISASFAPSDTYEAAIPFSAGPGGGSGTMATWRTAPVSFGNTASVGVRLVVADHLRLGLEGSLQGRLGWARTLDDETSDVNLASQLGGLASVGVVF